MTPARVVTRVLPLALAITTGCATAVQAQTAPWPSAPAQQQSGAPWPSAQPSAPQQPAGPWPSAQPSAPAPMSMGPPPSPGGPGMMSGPGPTPEQQKCLQEFTGYRAEVEKRAKAAEAESKKKPTREKMCELISGFSTAESKWVKFVESNMAKCGIPPQVVGQIKTVHVRTLEQRKKICAPGPTQASAPAAPSLSDALGASQIPNTADEKKHKVGGTMDTLTGPVLTR